MNIQLFSDNLRNSLNKQVSALGADEKDLVKIGQRVTIIRDTIRALKEFAVRYQFVDTLEEIDFFKRIKPEFVSIYLYHRKLFALALFDSFRDHEARQANHQEMLTKLEHYTLRHHQLYEYWITGACDLDPQYFTRGRIDHHVVDRDEKFSTGYDLKLAKLMANDQLRRHVLLLIAKGKDSSTFESGLRWTSQKSSLIELIYALHATKVFNNGNVDIKVIAAAMESVFNVPLGNFYRKFQDFKIRKANQTIFIDELKTQLIRRIEESEN